MKIVIEGSDKVVFGIRKMLRNFPVKISPFNGQAVAESAQLPVDGFPETPKKRNKPGRKPTVKPAE